MSPTHVNRGIVERRLERLQSAYGPVEVDRDRERHSRERFQSLRHGAEAGYVGGAYVWVTRTPDQAPPLSDSMPEDAGADRDRVLLILNRAAEDWGLPGGGLEGYGPGDSGGAASTDDDRSSALSGETDEAAAVREVREETGVECSITDCAWCRRVVVTCTAPDVDARLHGLYTFFDGRYGGGSVAIQPGELNGAAWFADLPARLLPATERRATTWDRGQ